MLAKYMRTIATFSLCTLLVIYQLCIINVVLADEWSLETQPLKHEWGLEEQTPNFEWGLEEQRGCGRREQERQTGAKVGAKCARKTLKSTPVLNLTVPFCL